MTDFVAGAFVDVKPDTRGFRADLKRQLDAAIKNSAAFKVPVEIDPKRFKSTVADALRGTTGKVPVEASINVAEFRKAVRDKITRATEGLKVRIPIEAVSATKAQAQAAARGARAGTGEAATTGGAAGTEAVAKSTGRATTARKQLDDVTKALQRSEQNLQLSHRLVAQTLDEQVPLEERATRLREARLAASAAIKPVNTQLVDVENKLNDAQRTSLETQLASAQAQRVDVATKERALRLDKEQTSVTNESAQARIKANEILSREVSSIKTLTDLNAHRNDLAHVEARLNTQTTRARDLNVTSAVNANQALLTEIERRKELIILQRNELKGEGIRSRQQRTAARGAGATALSLLGVRGATLAANSAFLVGAAGAALFAKSLQSFAQFETELNTFEAISGATADQMAAVSKRAKELGADIRLPAVTATDAAQAMTELSRAGLEVDDAMAGARGVLELAAAAQISNAEAATLTASALNAFGLAGASATRVADLLANAANASQGSIAEMGAALQQASAIARQVGLTLGNTVSILTLFARNGLRGSDAGTSLRTALSRLIAPTREASQLIDSLGLNVRDLQGNIRPDIFAQFGVATKDLSPALRDMIAQTIAGQDAIRAFAIGAREGTRGLKLAQLQMAQQGTAARVAAARTQGLAGAFSALRSNTETLGTQLGQFASGPVAEVTRALNDFVSVTNRVLSGDFSGFLDDAEKDFFSFARSIGKAASLIPTLPFQGLRNIPDLTDDEDTDRVKELLTELERLESLRIQQFKIGGNIGPTTERVKELRAQLRAAQVDAGLIVPVTPLEKALDPIKRLRKEAQELKKDLLAKDVDADVDLYDDIIREADAAIKQTTKNFSKSATREVELSSKDIARKFGAEFKLIGRNVELATPGVLAEMAKLANKIEGTAPLTGAAGREVGKTLIEQLRAAINAAVEADDPELAERFKKFATRIASLFSGSMAEAFRGLKVPLTDTQLAEALLPERIQAARAEAFGTVSDQIRTKQAELDGLNRQLEQVIDGSDQQEKVLNDIAAKKSEIRSLREQQAQDAKEADQKADQRIIDAIGGEERQRQNALIIAQNDESLANDLRAQASLRAFYQNKIAEVRRTVRDAETRRDQIDELEQNLFEIEQDIAENRAARRQQIRDARLKVIDDAAERASEDESLANDQRIANRRVAFWRNEVRVIRQMVRDRQATADELDDALDQLDAAEDAAREARRGRRSQLREQREERLALRIQIAQDTGNTNAEIAAREAQIKNTQRLIRQTRKNSLQRLRLIAQLRQEQRELRELRNEQEKANKGTTAFDILKQAADTFERTGGNLINGAQPFAGPSNFVADIAQWLRSQRSVSGVRGPQPPPPPTLPISRATERNDRAHFDRLITALDRNTDALTGKRNTGANVKGTGANVLLRNDRRFWDGAEARRESGGGV